MGTFCKLVILAVSLTAIECVVCRISESQRPVVKKPE